MQFLLLSALQLDQAVPLLLLPFLKPMPLYTGPCALAALLNGSPTSEWFSYKCLKII